ncbi:MAG: helix-turn-helix transcriptional regulator [Pseudonocardiaceae bacterium]
MTHDTNHDPGTDNEHRVMANRLREARETIGLTQADTASALDIPRSSVVALEAGKRKVTGLELRRLARLYRRSVAWLLGEESDEPEVADQALYRATAELSDKDKEQVLRFAQFLAAQAPRDASSPRAPRPRPTPPGGT